MKVVFDLKNYEINEKLEIRGLSLITLNSILSLMINKYIYSETESIRINSKQLQLKSNDYKEYLNILKECGIIIWNNYEVGVKSRDFFFTEKFKETSTILKIVSDADDEQTRLDQDNTINIEPRINQRLLNDLESVSVDLSKIKKEYYIDSKTDKEIYEFKKYIRSYLNAYRLKNKQLFFNWKSKRLYTPFTYCNSLVRLNAFNFNEDKLATIDIPSSHPLFLSLWALENGIDKNDYDFKQFCSWIKQGREKNKSIFYKELRERFDKMRNTDNKEIYNPELNIFTVYDKKHLTYDDSKLFFMRWLNSDYKNDFIHNTFKQYFPELDRIKQTNMYNKIVEMESRFIFNVIIPKLYELGGIRILTCHDQIYFQEKYLNDVHKIWFDFINKLYEKLPGSTTDSDIEDNIIIMKADSMKSLNPNKEVRKQPKWSDLNNNFDWDAFDDEQKLFK